MRCLLAALLILGMVIAALVCGWHWYGWPGVIGVGAAGFVLLWLLSRFGPQAVRGFFGEQLRQAAGPMLEARITVHSVTPADESDAIPEMLRQFDHWIESGNDDAGQEGFSIEADEFLTHNEERPDLARYFIDITVSPPESDPQASWSPHGIGLRPVGSTDASQCEVHDVTRFDAKTKSFRRFLEFAFEEVMGEQRIRLHAGLDPDVRDYQFEYAFVNPLAATVSIPEPNWSESPRRRFALGVLDRVVKKRPLNTLSLSWLDIRDADLSMITGCTELEWLALSDTHVTDEGVSQLMVLENLGGLDLSGTQISEDSLHIIAKLPKLKRLFVRNTEVTQTAIGKLRDARPDLEVHHK